MTGGPSGTGGVHADAGGQTSDAGGQTSAPRASTGCGSDPVLAHTSIEVNGVQTNYIVDVPPAYDKTRAYPLVMAFRRSETTAEAFRESLGLPLAAGADAILVHPDCPDGASTWDVPGDLPMVDALLVKLASSYCIDQDRVFAIGLGQGALLVNAFGCARSGTLRGLAPAPRPFLPRPQRAAAGPPCFSCKAARTLQPGHTLAKTATSGSSGTVVMRACRWRRSYAVRRLCRL